MSQILAGVAVAHHNGIVHRDLSPSNILVTEDGRPHVLDFGIARLLDDDDPARRTQRGQILGTLAYSAPLLSTLFLVLAGEAEPGWTLLWACLLIAGGALLASKQMLRRRAPEIP